MQARDLAATLAATLAAAALPTLVLMVLVTTIASDEITRDEWWIVAGLLFGIALAHVVLLGLPAVLVLRRMRRYRIVPMAIAGILVGALPYAIFSFPFNDAAGVDVFSDGVQTMANGVTTTAGWMEWLQEAAVFGALGFVGALAFYGVRRTMAEVQSDSTDA